MTWPPDFAKGRLLARTDGKAGTTSIWAANRLDLPSGEVQGLSPLDAGQNLVFGTIMQWVLGKPIAETGNSHLLTTGGYGGTGKTFLLAHLSAELESKHVPHVMAAPTGKAAAVLRRKLAARGVHPSFCGTIHSLMYEPEEGTGGKVVAWERKPELETKLIIIDEASMVSQEMLADLQSYGIPILAVGDHGQLPPVGENAGLMANPDLRLEVIHRQAADNPILALAHQFRQEGTIRRELLRANPGDVTLRIAGQLPQAWLTPLQDPALAWDTGVLCYSNRRRMEINARIASLQVEDSPKQVMILRNQRVDGMRLANGMRGLLLSQEPADALGRAICKLYLPDEELLVEAPVYLPQIGMEGTLSTYLICEEGDKHQPRSWNDIGLLMDQAYALTVHKSQGSEFNDVMVELSCPSGVDQDTFRRWGYTAFTRAAKRLRVAIGQGVELV